MESLVIPILASIFFLIVTYLIKKNIIDNKEPKDNTLSVKDSSGKVRNILIQGSFNSGYLEKLLLEEYEFEDRVEDVLKKYKKRNKDFNFYKNKYIDFLLDMNDTQVGVIVRTKHNVPVKEYYKIIKEEYPSLDELVLIFNSEIPSVYKDKDEEIQSKIKFISSPNGRKLFEKVNNVLNSEFIQEKNITKKSS